MPEMANYQHLADALLPWKHWIGSAKQIMLEGASAQ